MKLDAKPTLTTLGYSAYEAIKKHFKKTLKCETSVKQDEDPEALHQMRVGMRRLRTAVTGFAPAVDLPKQVSDKNIGKIARCLGNLRDLDVLKDALKNRYQPNLPSKEQKSLEAALDTLANEREDAFADVRTTLKGKRYKSLKQGLQKWLEEPNYQAIAAIPIQQVLPDLLLPELSRFLLHPGWLVGTEVKDGEIVILKDLEPEQVEEQLTAQGETLHSLRKEAKRVRYQMELFTEFYASTYEAYLNDIKTIQEILGNIQDRFVLAEFLQDSLEAEIKTELPSLASQLEQTSYQAWQHWQTLQQRYLNSEIRRNFHSAILHSESE